MSYKQHEDLCAERGQAQVDHENQVRLQQQEVARQVVLNFSKRKDLPPSDTETILMSLGLMESPPPVIKRSFK